MMQRTPGMNARGLPETPVMNTHGGWRPAAVFSELAPLAPAGNGEYDAAAAHDGELAAIAAEELAPEVASPRSIISAGSAIRH